MRSKLFAVLAAVFLGTAFISSSRDASAHEPHPGLNVWISVEGVPNCTTQSGDATCDLAPGSTFVIDAHLDPLPSDLPQYDGFDVSLRHSGVTPNQDASTDAWPDCGFPAISYDEAPDTDIVRFACAIGVPPAGPSTYTGLIGTESFACAASGTISLVHGINNTDVLDDSLQAHAEDPNTAETLTINCVQGGIQPPPVTPGGAPITPGPTLEPTAAAKATATAAAQGTIVANEKATLRARETPGTGTVVPGGGGPTGSSGGGLAGWLIAVIIVGGVAAAGAAGFVGWRVMQSRRAPGP